MKFVHPFLDRLPRFSGNSSTNKTFFLSSNSFSENDLRAQTPFTNFQDMVNRPRHNAVLTFRPLNALKWHSISWMLQHEPKFIRGLLKRGMLQPFGYSAVGESLYYLAFHYGNQEMMQLILSLIPSEHLLKPIWVDGEDIGPSYTQEAFRVILEKPSSKDSVAIASRLSGKDLFELAKSIAPDIASSLLARGISIDKATGPDGQSVWHAVVQYHEQPQGLLQWLLNIPAFPSTYGHQMEALPSCLLLSLENWMSQAG